MSSSQNVDDQVLTDYLFGDLPETETERLDELSIVNDDFAARLHDHETDLVDAYVRGELSGNTRKRFEAVYLSSQARRERVAFAEQLKNRVRPGMNREAPVKSTRASWTNFFRFPRFAFAGGLAMLLLAGFLLSKYLQPPVQQSASTQAPSRTSGSAPAVNEKPTVEAQPETADTTAAPHSPSLPVNVVAFVLVPQMRDATQIPRLELPATATRADFHLELEANDFSHYRVTLKSLKSERPLWQSAALIPAVNGDHSTLAVRIPAGVLSRGMYQLELSGTPSNGEAEFAASYTFRIEPR